MIDELYSARILKLAANLPHSGRLTAPQGTGERVAKLCGSKAIVDVTLDEADRVEAFAQDVKACALGQAAAGVLGEAVIGASLDELVEARDAMSAMLKAGGEGPAGRFEGLRALKQVADYPARHASTMVAIEATLDAMREAVARKSPDTRTSLAGAA
ncbi:MAG: iron-sulfur cluster assembly scaffold protein [Alphaproteobacteria bacterium]|uniref:iron-sulfur cluster assembly scaffold protein n=1 Tax=Brevundimonas sp. TaxID=1871086 RepID=UPI00180B24B9|nr:iron-sulfur cluster assembly scaffold protein [Brevundimonas sp.]MBA3050312.1 iron-sulfur cluster assembly scaffold protein [Brevundimonas sp.]MBU3973585.1 iron-sulfur cluster assembly scaffold protein [Alphaproteobacteria bacterium]MBU4039029.1 iron-sulfur cluster assembly scaffold protein [Alphaproteobacteria bacterium]MBU4136522.1 iron-sulfur cluster assembly scaffold protein [Alphaproteobacteria bacterium]